MDQLIDQLRGEEPEDLAHFTLSRERARSLAKQHLLEKPREYILFLVRAALRRGAPEVRIILSPNRLVVLFGGTPFTRGELDRLEDAVVAPPGGAASPGLRELALGVLAARTLDFDIIRVTSSAETGTEAVSLVFEPRGPRRLVPETPKKAVTRIEIQGVGRVDGEDAVLYRGQRVERYLLNERCRYTAHPIYLNTRLIGAPAAFEAVTAAYVELEEEGLRARAGLMPREPLPAKPLPAQVRFLMDDVWVATEPLKGAEPGFVAYVQTDGLRLDLAQAKVIQDDSHARALRTAYRLQRAAAKQHDIPATQEAHNRRYLKIKQQLHDMLGSYAGRRLGQGLAVGFFGVLAVVGLVVLAISRSQVAIFLLSWLVVFIEAAILSRIWHKNDERLLRELREAFDANPGDRALAELAFEARQDEDAYRTARSTWLQLLKTTPRSRSE